MSYFALYRKYRPSTVNDVVGQDYIVKVIKNSLKNNRVSHAYLFSGPRGTGKTTMAKILAKNVNCLNPIDGCSCGKCKNCLCAVDNSCTDIIEIDAASNNGVDEIREIKNNINLVPTELKYKVYIIDEVHMLSIGAFNALLKTLEEPPEHVIFILATTDVHKVPVTIVSRCQCFDFHRLSEKNIVDRLKFIVKKENMDVEDGVLSSIANLSEGGLRDAIGMLDKIYSYSDEKITLNDFELVNGIVSSENKNKFLNLIFNKDVKSVINFIDDIYNSGKDLSIFYNDLLVMCRNMIVDYYMNKKIDFDIDFLINFVDTFSKYGIELKNSNNIRIVFEIKTLLFMNLNNNKFTEIVDKTNCTINKTEPITKNIATDTTIDSNTEFLNDNYKSLIPTIINNCFARANKKELENLKSNWNKFNDYALDSEYGAIACYLVDGTLRAASDTDLIITFDYDSMVIRGYTNINIIEHLFDKIFQKKYNIAIITTDEWNKFKQDYIDNKNKGIVYEYKEIQKQNINKKEKVTTNSTTDSVTTKAIELFGDDVVSN